MGDWQLRPSDLPRHVAVIMDGNGRWAERRGLDRSEGHRAGVEAVRAVTRAARELGIPWLTLFAFSTENWKRPRGEIDVLMGLPEAYFESELDEALENDVRIRTVGRIERLPASARRAVEEAVERTRGGRGMQLCFALSYGGRAEIVDAAKRLLRDQELGKVDAESLDERSFRDRLDEPEMPDVDLLIRTGGERRVSNFLLWEIAYAELHVSDALWPDFDREHLEAALIDYARRERRFGRTSAQLRGRGDAPR